MNQSLAAMSKNELAEKYFEVLHPLEALVTSFFKRNPELYDSDVQKAYECLLKDVKAQLTNYPKPTHKLTGDSEAIYTRLAEFLKGMENEYLAEEIQACLKQLDKSVKLWNREFGMRGYLNYIGNFNL